MKKQKILLTLLPLLLVACGGTSSSTTSNNNSTSSVTSSSSEQNTSSSSSEKPSSSIEEKATITITNEEKEAWVDEELKITTNITGNLKGELNFKLENNDQNIAEMTGDTVKFLKEGTITIIAFDSLDENTKDSITLTIKDTIINANVFTENWDYSKLKTAEPSITTIKPESSDVNARAYFKNVVGKTYMMEATFNILSTSTGDTWSRISLGHVTNNEDSKFHGMVFSPGPNGTARKTVVMDMDKNGGVQWGLVTDRSQAWNFNGVGELDLANIKMTTIRNENEYYYFINDRLFWAETLYQDFNEIDTIPTIHVASAEAEVTKMSITTDVEEINTVLSSTAAKQKFYPTNANNVIISEDSTSIEFKNCKNGAPTNMKDNAAKSIGDLMTLPANKQASIEFDVKFNDFGDDPDNAALVVSMSRYDNNPAETRSYLVSKFRYGFTAWNSNGDLPAGIGAPNDLAEPLSLDTTYHVKLNRLMVSEGTSQDCSMSIGDNNATWGWTNEGDSTGNVTLWFAARTCDVVVSNIVINIEE